MKKLILLAIATVSMAAVGARAADGKATYTDSCVKCHGEDGAGKTKMGEKLGARDYSQKATWAEITDQRAVQSLLQGMKKDDKTLMKPFSDLSPADAQAVITYMRTLATK